MITLTICITTYNRWNLCLNALHSVCGQEGVSFEVILVDDCSPEPMPREVADFIEANGVRFIRHEQNKGLTVARNTAIEHARGAYFAFCDDDDQWPQGHAAGLVQAMHESGSGVGMAVGMSKTRKAACCKILEGQPKLSILFLEGFTPPVGSQIYKTNLIRKVGGYNPDVRSGVDHELWVNLLEVDPRVAVSWGEPVIVGNEPTRERMTTNEKRRRSGYQKALEIWKPKLIAVLGEDFYRHFCYSYELVHDYNFFVQAVRNKEYTKAFHKAASLNVIKMVTATVYRKISGSQKCNYFPRARVL